MKASNDSTEIYCCHDVQEAARLGADLIATQLRQQLESRSRVTLFLSGGKSPVVLFEQLAKIDLDWQRIETHLVDERFAPAQPQDQNATLLQRYFLQGNAKESSFHPLLIDESLEHCIQTANARTAAVARPDLVVLGMGLDGHTASLFPGAPEYGQALQTGAHYIALHPSTAPYPRISMSLFWLQQARSVMLFIPGAEKQQAYDYFVTQRQGISPLPTLFDALGTNATVIVTGGYSP